jgi:phosphopantothenoylcysteine decarboxylase
MNIILGITGSVASTVMHKLRQELIDSGNEVKLVVTEKAKLFISEDEYCYYYDDESDFENRYYSNPLFKDVVDQSIKHIELRDWADCIVIAPCSANTLAKISYGICDNLLTSIVRAWDWSKPFYIAPAMNTKMFEHPVTLESMNKIEKWAVQIIYPTSNVLACGDIGIGAMAHIKTIANIVNGHQWNLDWFKMEFLPLENHPGGFGTIRKECYHNGVDIYMDIYSLVGAVEDGEIVSIGQFTGEAVGCGWWNDTWQVTVKGRSGNICYGKIEVNKKLKVGDKVKAGQPLGDVMQVLKNAPKKYIPYHKMSMLHLELMNDDLIEVPDWKIGCKKHKSLLDPTPYLYLQTHSDSHDPKIRIRRSQSLSGC